MFMFFSVESEFAERKEADLLVIPFWQTPKKPKPVADLGAFAKKIQAPIETGDFTAKIQQTALLYLQEAKNQRCLLLGLGKEEELTIDLLRRAASTVVQIARSARLLTVQIVLPHLAELKKVTFEDFLEGLTEGFLLSNYSWNEFSEKKEEKTLLKNMILLGVQSKLALPILKRVEAIAQGVYVARDLINGSADKVTPQFLAKIAKQIAKEHENVTATVFDKAKIQEEKMGLLLAVARGSSVDPSFIILSYKGHSRSKDHTVIIGKGVTYDTGGLNLKPTGFMEKMRQDMSGSACALATVEIAASLKLKVNVTAVVAATENSIDANSYKPGDIYQGYTGHTVEIDNTDAEGRLTLADALGYTVAKLHPSRMIDFATLTGAIVISLGEKVAGLFSNNDELATALLESSLHTSEKLWRMPLESSYNDLLKSEIADIKNCGGRPAGSITAALFLQKFVKDIPWAHIDIAGTAFSSKVDDYLPQNAIGYGIRLMMDFLRKLEK